MSILIGFSKIVEKWYICVYSFFFLRCSVLMKTPYGVQNDKSTSAIFDVLTNICENIDNNNYTVVILLKLQKSIWYSILFYIIE